MTKKGLTALAGILLGIVVFTSGFGMAVQEDKETSDRQLHVAAASSLRFAFEEIGDRFLEEEGIEVVFQFNASGNLARQIAHGAPVDLFASADGQFIDALMKQGKLEEGSSALFARGRIVLAYSKEYSEPVTSLDDLLSESVHQVTMANPEHAPFGKAAKEALERSGNWKPIEDKMVYAASVMQALQYIETGNVSAGIISKSVASSEKLHYNLIDESLHDPLNLYYGIVAGAEEEEWAHLFALFLMQEESASILQQHGFDLP